MADLSNERVVYINGEIVPESRAMVSFRDRSFKYGDGAFDMTRTFGHRIFKLDEHLKRFYKSLKYLQMDPGMSLEKMKEISEEVLARNLHLLGEGEDYWVAQRVSRGVEPVGGDIHDATEPTVVIECTPLPFKARAHYFRDGMEVVIPSTRRTAPDSLTPRAKTHNYMNLMIAHEEVRRQNANAWAILLDVNGNLCEGVGSNIFIVEGGVVYTPEDRFVLCGVSRQTAIDLAEAQGLKVVRKELDLYDAYTADEAFITSTSFCIVPVNSFNGIEVGDGAIPGPITKRITDAYIKFVDHDFVGQYLNHLD
jgi:branched-chain amino acid aminotransferase